MSGIYIHIPFCKQACHYCDFHFSTSMGKKEAMVSALQKELVLRKDEFKNELIETIYFGGGTPSVLSVNDLQSLIQSVYDNYEISTAPEITLEANPDDLSLQKIEALAESPVNRLSIGIQSFFESDLKLMNRAHNAIEAEECLQQVKKHFDNISIDLIYGIPDMSNVRWKSNIDKAVSLDIPHISSYALTVEPNTALASFIKKGIVKNVDDEVAEAHFHILSETLEAAGFKSYEISNFGKPGYFSRNNTAYWKQKKYMGIGPSAHSFDGIRRGWNINNNPKYIKAIQNSELPMEIEVLSITDKYNEYVMTGLRTIWGVSLSKISLEYGKIYWEYVMKQAEKYIEQHLLDLDGDTLITTKKGRFLADGIASDLFMLNLS
ncbi:MAG TPA: radical SAM family heme chaperone HemW [Pricia antarctica]|uniref:Heme chaperone HemW n=2 Tax=root TaxID=1 RepID=A0A831VT68_9FLAO|nr:radical SAM family heme chaperone HemW [Pricia antarctica]